MNTRRAHATSRNRLARFEWLSPALAALLALPPVAFATQWGALSPRSFAAAESAMPAPAGLVYQVNTTGDAAGIPPLSRCDTNLFTSGAQCTLRAALQATNAVAGEDTITFNIPATDPGCDSATGRCVINLTQALPDITESVAVDGPGPELLTVKPAATFRVFNVTTAGTVTISGLTISGGLSTGNTYGGAIRNFSTGIVNINNCIITGNGGSGFDASPGGAIFNGTDGTMNINNSTISDNGGRVAGGIYNERGTLNVTN